MDYLFISFLKVIIITVQFYVGSGLNTLPDDPVSLQPQVTLQKCPGATIEQDWINLPPHLVNNDLAGLNKTFVFNLTSSEPQCSEQYRKEFSESRLVSNDIKNLFFKSDDNQTVTQDQTDYQFQINLQGVLTVILGNTQLYRQIKDYCIQEAHEILTVSFCDNACNDRPCIPKCCMLHEVIDMGNSSEPQECRPSGEYKWTPKFHSSDEQLSSFLTEAEHLDIKPYIFYRPFPSDCTIISFIHEAVSSELIEIHPSLLPDDIQEYNFRILRNGTLIVKDTKNGEDYWSALKQGEYCVDGIQNFGKEELFSGDSFKHLILFRCINDSITDDGYFTPEEIESSANMEEIRIVVYWVTIPFASMFLVLTIVVYILVWDIHNIHGHTLFSYVCSLFGFYVFLFFSQIRIFKHGSVECAFTGVGIHLFFLITACWLTTINFDVFWTFRRLKVGRAPHNLKRYLCYSGFSFGVPILIVFISVLLNNQYKDIEESSPIVIPNYGKDVCALSNDSVGYYLYTPVGILIGCNIIFFLWTIGILIQYQRSIGAALKGTTNNKEDQSLSVFIKLFVVMGISWIFEIIGWAAQRGQTVKSAGLSWTFAILDVINVLLAVAIFFIFVWKRIIYERLWIRYPAFRPLLSLCVFGGCCVDPAENQRPSFSAHTMSTLGRGGTLVNRKASAGSVGDVAINRPRKLSSSSRTSSTGEKRASLAMSTLSETDEENLEQNEDV